MPGVILRESTENEILSEIADDEQECIREEGTDAVLDLSHDMQFLAIIWMMTLFCLLLLHFSDVVVLLVRDKKTLS